MAKSNKNASLSSRSFRWESEGDRSNWQQYSPDIQELLTTAFDAGKNEISIDESGKRIDFHQMTETDENESKTRRIRLAMELKDKNGFFLCEFQNEKKKWLNYRAAVMLKIAETLDEDENIVELDESEIDLNRLIETNSTTKQKRKIHFVKSMAKFPLNVSTQMNKRVLESEDEPQKKRSGSKSIPVERPAVRTIKTKVGQVPVDSECRSMIDKAHVYCEDDDVFDCMLNQTNVGNNNNKFYLIQLLEEDQRKHYYIWLRWGRVGYNGQTNLMNFGANLDDAKRFFCQKFSDKTRNDFYHREEFVKYPGKYDYVQLDYNPSKEIQSKPTTTSSTTYPESKLDERVQNLIRLICSIQAMEEALLEMKFDARKNPLGKLSSNQIKAGYAALKEIETFIKKNQFNALFIEANNIYYTRIPHEFGRSTPPLIKTVPQLKNEIELLEALDDIEIVFSDLQNDENIRLNPVDRQYQSLKCQIVPMSRDEKIYSVIEEYLQSTHASTHQQYRMEIEEIFQIQREKETELFNDVGNKMLLWHGSRLTNFAGILSQGLRIAPPEAPMTGYMFGKGLYFADMSSKSANYCYPTSRKNTGLVLLSEVALGKSQELVHADNNAHRLAEGFSSVKGLGSMAPNLKNSITLDDGVVVPMGPAEPTNVLNPKGYTLNYNEYIVYDTRQVRLRYLIRLKFNFLQD